MINEEASYRLAIENAKQAVQDTVDEMGQFYKEVCAELNDGYKYLIGKKVRIYTKSFNDSQRTYEGWFYGFEAIRENYYVQYTPITPHVKLFKCKKDGSESKVKQDIYTCKAGKPTTFTRGMKAAPNDPPFAYRFERGNMEYVEFDDELKAFDDEAFLAEYKIEGEMFNETKKD